MRKLLAKTTAYNDIHAEIVLMKQPAYTLEAKSFSLLFYI